MSLSIVNTSGYFFKPLNDLPNLKVEILDRCRSLNLRGTVLLASEGVNLMLAGDASAIAQIQQFFEDRFATSIRFKDSVSESLPFNRMLVKIKAESVTFGVEGLDIHETPAPYVTAKTLAAWLDQGHDDEGRPIMILDTRNDYEFRIGHFAGSIVFPIRHFRDFPNYITEVFKEQWASHTVVTCCTGGIRCEKAAPFLVKEGMQPVYQLEGGILTYFEEVGSRHWVGECFVFDHRTAVNTTLEETPTTQCYACRMPVTPEELAHPAYQLGVSCPACHKESA